jgi:multidrug efflux pump subunit AcrA (membrane-fusion protein)
MSLRAVTPLRLATPFALSLLVACSFGSPAPTPTPDAAALEPVPRVVADGRVLPARSAELRFLLESGTVAEILVGEGDQIEAGVPLARLDAAELEAAVAQARAAVDEAGAQLELLQAGALPAAVAAAEAQVAQAQAGERQAEGRVTAADIQAARDELREAQALLARLTAGPKGTEVEQAEAALAQAQAGLATQRDSLSAAKTDGELRLQQAANALRDAQDAYSRVYWDNRDLERAPGDLPQERRDQEAAALRAVENSETALAQAQVDLERARQAEVSGIAQAEAQVRDAQARLDQLLAGADTDQIAAARARVSAAQARIASLTGEAREGEIAAAQAGVVQAQAALDEVTAGPRSAEIAVAEARVRARQADLRRAEVAMERATLLAPFAGTVVELNLELGEQPPAAEPALVLADMSAWKVETSDLTELDIVNVRVGDPVTLSFDALPDLIIPGVVTKVESLGKTFQGDVIYTVAVEPREWDERLRWNMTATVTVEGE